MRRSFMENRGFISVHAVKLTCHSPLPRIIRTLPTQVPLTSLVFSPEGAAIYAGTEDGRVLLLDLRALDKPPKEISVSESGERIECMARR